MDSFSEGRIDKATEALVSSNKQLVKSTNDISEANGNSFYGDLSELTYETNFMRRLSEEVSKASGYQNKVIYIVVNGWNPDDKDSPANILLKSIKSNPTKFKESFSNISFVFVNTSTNKNFALVVDKYEPNQYNTVIGLLETITRDIQFKAVTGKAEKKTPEKIVISQKEIDERRKEEREREIAEKIQKMAAAGDPEDFSDAIKDIKNNPDVMAAIAQDKINSTPRYSKARAGRMSQLDDKFLKLQVGNGKTVSDLFAADMEIQPAHLEVATINKEDWDQLKFSNFEKTYDIDRDIYTMLQSLSDENKQYPISIKNVKVEDSSTSMDYIYTYTVNCEDSFGKLFTFKFDIPIFINDRFMMLRGNEKAMSGQLVLLPCLKTDQDTVQLVSNYNKIFLRRYGMVGKSYPDTDRIIKVLTKYKGKKIKITGGDNTLICNKYNIAVDYIDLASIFSTIEISDRVYYFDQDIYYKKYNADPTKGLPYAVMKKTNEVLYYTEKHYPIFTSQLVSELKDADPDGFYAKFLDTKPADRLNYSQASILANKIPLIVILSYHIGLNKVLEKMQSDYGLEYTWIPSTNRSHDKTGTYISIKFSDYRLEYKPSYEASLLLNGLSEVNTRAYSIGDVDSQTMWLDALDDFGGRILSDGLNNFKDLFMDPITVEICRDCMLPTNYIDLLIYANNLLADNKYNRHTDISGNRYRSNEIVAAYFYIALGKAYEQYANNIRRGSRGPLTMKQTAVIDAILTSNISSDLSTLNPLLELTTASTTTFKGPSGMNSDRAYGLDKRTYDESMINKLALSTGFAANVGIDRQATIDMDVEGIRGYIKDTKQEDMSVTKTFSMSEAVTPFGTTSDDPFRSAMTYIQTSKHSMRTKKSSPLLITNGSDEAMPYMNSDTYAVKAQDDGVVEELTDDYMIVKYKNPIPGPASKTDKPSEYRSISLKETVKKNSDGGFYITIKLDTDLKKGSKFKKNDIIAYDKGSFSRASESGDLAYNLGVLTKVAIMSTDEGFEDSTSVSMKLSENMASEIVTMRDTPPLPRLTNIYHIVKVGDPIQEGDPLIIYQNAFDEEDANMLLKSITDEDIVSDLGRIRIKSKYTGVVQDIKIYRTCEIEEMSDTMAKIVKDYEKQIKATRAMYKKYNIPGSNRLDPDYIMPETGKLKNCHDGIIIEFYIKYNDKLGVGDKIVAQSANKGTIKDIFPEGMEPFSEYNPDESIDAIFANRSFNARMVTSVFKAGAINKVLIELDRRVKDIMGLKQIPIDEVNEH